MTTKITGVSFVNTAEGMRVAYTYSKIDDNGNITTSNARGSYIDDSESISAFLKGIEPTILSHID